MNPTYCVKCRIRDGLSVYVSQDFEKHLCAEHLMNKTRNILKDLGQHVMFSPSSVVFWHKHQDVGECSFLITNKKNKKKFVARYEQRMSDTWERSEVSLMNCEEGFISCNTVYSIESNQTHKPGHIKANDLGIDDAVDLDREQGDIMQEVEGQRLKDYGPRP